MRDASCLRKREFPAKAKQDFFLIVAAQPKSRETGSSPKIRFAKHKFSAKANQEFSLIDARLSKMSITGNKSTISAVLAKRDMFTNAKQVFFLIAARQPKISETETRIVFSKFEFIINPIRSENDRTKY